MIRRTAWPTSIICIAAAIFAFSVSGYGKANSFSPISAEDQAAAMHRGMNILDADPVWNNSTARFDLKRFHILHDAGFDTVRINLHVFSHMDASGRIESAWLSTLDRYVGAALDGGFTVVLDEHDDIPCNKDIKSCPAKLLLAWNQIAGRYRDQPNKLLFEFLNEPFGALTPELWNVLSHSLLKVVRGSNPVRNVIIGPAGYSKLDYLNTLDLPPDDRHIIVAVHYYWPARFTHQGVEWIPEFAHLSGITFGSEQEKAKISTDFDQIKAWSKANARPIFLGEFGAYEQGDLASRSIWISTITRNAEAHGFPWAFWEFETDFAAYDMKKNEWISPILQALVPPR